LSSFALVTFFSFHRHHALGSFYLENVSKQHVGMDNVWCRCCLGGDGWCIDLSSVVVLCTLEKVVWLGCAEDVKGILGW
jgi:hypothetical protein